VKGNREYALPKDAPSTVANSSMPSSERKVHRWFILLRPLIPPTSDNPGLCKVAVQRAPTTLRALTPDDVLC